MGNSQVNMLDAGGCGANFTWCVSVFNHKIKWFMRAGGFFYKRDQNEGSF